MNCDTTENTWHVRHFDLSSYAGKTVSDLNLVTDGGTPAGSWTVYYLDLVLVSADGTVRPIFNGQPGESFSVSATSGVSSPSAQEVHFSGQGQFPDLTQYYHSDHLGSARLTTSYAGYPTYSATFLPFGEEWNPQATINHYKFDGKERDAESGLDDFGARYYASTYGRFMSADWSAIPEPVPYANLSNPQTLNLYAIVHGNPETFAGLDGHQSPADGIQRDCSIADDQHVCTENPINQQNIVTASKMNESTQTERTMAGDTAGQQQYGRQPDGSYKQLAEKVTARGEIAAASSSKSGM